MTQIATLHGTAVAHAGAGILLMGKSGSGKSRIAAEMIMHGARLVADDQVVVTLQSGMLMGAATPQLANVLELRGIGLVRLVDSIPRHVLHVVVELTEEATERLPERQTFAIEGHVLPLLRVQPAPVTGAASLLLAIKAMQEGRMLPTDWRPGA